jgi:hypothetical protein
MFSIQDLKSTGIFFITGRPRSGTTLLRTLFDAHQNIVVPFECNFIIDLFPKYGNTKKWSANIKESFLKNLYKQPLFNFWEIDQKTLREEFLNQPPEMSYSDVCKFIYLHFKSLIPKEKIVLIGDKNPIYTIHLKRLSKLFPDAKFIHIVRDYKDQISSMLKVDFEKPFIPSLAFRWKYFNRIACNFKKEYPEKILFVKYEDFVKSPETEAVRMFNFLGIPFQESILNFYKEKDVFEKIYSKEKIEKYHKELFQPITTRRIGMWKQNIKENKIEAIETIIGKTADACGYERKHKTFRFKFLPIYITGAVSGKSFYLLYRMIYCLPVNLKRKILLALDVSIKK